MAVIVTRTGKGSPLTTAELDANFTNLNNNKIDNVAGGNMLGILKIQNAIDMPDYISTVIDTVGSPTRIIHDPETSNYLGLSSAHAKPNSTHGLLE